VFQKLFPNILVLLFIYCLRHVPPTQNKIKKIIGNSFKLFAAFSIHILIAYMHSTILCVGGLFQFLTKDGSGISECCHIKLTVAHVDDVTSPHHIFLRSSLAMPHLAKISSFSFMSHSKFQKVI
jgi:hypothetical protein